jgi:hypothetical protein
MRNNEKKSSISHPRKARTYSPPRRMRRHRQRRREGLTHVPIDLRSSEIDGLVRLGFSDVNVIRTGLNEYFESKLEPHRDVQQIQSLREPGH